MADYPDTPGVYVLHFANGKKYVGASARSIRIRLLHHFRAAEAGRTKTAVRKALAKYGSASVTITYLDCEGCPFDQESRIIADLKRQGVTLYNMTDGGEGTSGYQHGKETRRSMSRSAKQSWTPERRKAASQTLTSPEVRARLSASQRAAWSDHRRKEMAEHIRKRAAKLTEANVTDIARRLSEGQSCASIGRLYSVTPEAISAIKHGKNWGHVTGINRVA